MSPPRPLDVDHTLPEQGMILRAHDLDVQEHVAFQRARSVGMQHKCRIAHQQRRCSQGRPSQGRFGTQLISVPTRWTPGHETLLLLEHMSKR